MSEALVYIGVVFVILGVGFIALYHCLDNSVVLRRNADDVANALHTGERWRADLRAATKAVRLENSGAEQVLHLQSANRQVDYWSVTNALYRRVDAGPWARLLENVKSSAMTSEARQHVTVWHWELELQTRAHGSVRASRVRPLFTFMAVPPASP
jgi:hypothetical protein